MTIFIDSPSLGDHIRSSREYTYNELGLPHRHLILLDGGSFDETLFPSLFEKLQTNILPNRDSGDLRIPYKIVGDLV